jgi:DMSO/TMAO reductase YedYZ molybdopterin-dependent catalytic subunit
MMFGKALKIGIITALGIGLQLFSLAGASAESNSSTVTTASGGYSSRFRIDGSVANPMTYTLSKLQALPPTSEYVFFYTGQGPVSSKFTGVLLWDLLNSVGIKTDPSIKNDIINKSLVVTGSDGYTVTISAGELDPSFGGQQVLVAYAQDGNLLGADTGFARLIFPGDKAGARDLFWITSIKVH